MAKLAAEFLAGTPPKAQDLEGEWKQTTQVVTQPYLTGQNGSDHVAFDSAGLRNGGARGETLAWRLVIDRKLDGGLTITSYHYSVHPNVYNNPWSPGDLVLDTEAEADEATEYHCRLAGSNRLVCLDLEHIGDGAAFARMPRALTSQLLAWHQGMWRDCLDMVFGVACPPMRPLDILAGAQVCYHLGYSLIHVTPFLTDTWLVLDGDGRPPIGQRDVAAVFDDSVSYTARWWGTEPDPKTAFTRDSDPFVNRMQFRVLVAGSHLQGSMDYDDRRIRGEVYDEAGGHGWGVDGERRTCPDRATVSSTILEP